MSPEMLVDAFIAFFEPFDVLKGDAGGGVERKIKTVTMHSVFFSPYEDNGAIPTGKVELS